MKKCVSCFLFFITLIVAIPSYAKTISYDFKDPKGVNAVSINVDSPLEPTQGFAGTIEGVVTIDPVERKIVSGKLIVPVSSVNMSNSGMTKVLHSKGWLDAEKNPFITFEYIRTISIAETLETKYQLTVEGNMTIAGVTQTITAPVTLTFHPGRLKDRNPNDKGNLMILRSTFEINRKAFNINPSAPSSIVGDTIKLTLNIAGANRP